MGSLGVEVTENANWARVGRLILPTSLVKELNRDVDRREALENCAVGLHQYRIMPGINKKCMYCDTERPPYPSREQKSTCGLISHFKLETPNDGPTSCTKCFNVLTKYGERCWSNRGY